MRTGSASRPSTRTSRSRLTCTATRSTAARSPVRRTAKRLLRDLLLVGAPALALAVWFLASRHPLHNTRPVGGPQVDVSHVERVESEATVAVDPSNPRRLLAGSNDDLFITRIYTSEDGGHRWRSFP